MSSTVNYTKSLAKNSINKEVKYVWKIERHLIEDSHRTRVKSPAFFSPSDSGSDTKVTWILELVVRYPVYDNCTRRGKRRGIMPRPPTLIPDQIGVTRTLNLHMFTSDTGQYNFDIMTSFQGKYTTQNCTMTLDRGYGVGEYEFELMKTEQLSPMLARISPQDEVIFEVKITYFKEPCLKGADNFGTQQCSSCAEPHNLCATLLSDPTLSDVTLKVQGRDFKCHKVILSTVSPVFRAIFRKKSENLVEIIGLDPEVVDSMIKYIYTGKVPNLDELLAADLFVAADRYKLDKLKALAQRYLLEEYEISIADAPRLLALADLHSIDELKTKVVQFNLDNLDEVRMTQDWKIFVQKDANLLNLILDQVSSNKRKRNAEENN